MEIVRAVLGRLAGDALLAALQVRLTEMVREEGTFGHYWIRIEIGPADPAPAGQQVGEGNGRVQHGAGLTPLDRAILAVATGEPRTAGQLAKQVESGRLADSYFRQRLRHLVAEGLLAHDWRGYRLGESGHGAGRG